MLKIAQVRDSQNSSQEILVQNRNSYTSPETAFLNISGGLVVSSGKGATNIADTLATNSSYQEQTERMKPVAAE